MIILDKDQLVMDYLNKHNFLFESDSLLEDDDINKKIEQIKDKYSEKRKKLKESTESKLKEFFTLLKSNVSADAKELAKEKIKNLKFTYYVKKKIFDIREKIEIRSILSKRNVRVASGAALASIIIYGGYKVYENNKLKFSKECSKKTGYQKQVCFIKCDINSLRKRLDFLKKNIFRCKNSKNPIECKIKVDKEILKIRESLKTKASQIGSNFTTSKFN